MPLYEYECEACGRRFELIRKFSDPLPEECRLCGKGPVVRLPSSPAIQFKGSGFYITDYPKTGEGAKGEGGGAGKSDKTATEKSQDARSDAAAAGKGTDKTDKATPAAAPKSDTVSTPAASPKSDAPAKPSGSTSGSTTGGGSSS